MSWPIPYRLIPLLATALTGATTPAGGVASSAPTGRTQADRPALRIAQERDGLFRLTLPVNGAAVRFVVDTGANVVVLTPQDAARIGARPLSADGRRLRTAGGESMMSETRIEGLTIAGRRLGPIRAVIVAEATASLLGQNVLGQIDSVTLRGDQLELR